MRSLETSDQMIRRCGSLYFMLLVSETSSGEYTSIPTFRARWTSPCGPPSSQLPLRPIILGQILEPLRPLTGILNLIHERGVDRILCNHGARVTSET